MNQFDPELFSRLRDQWRLREGALVDLKAEIYQVAGNISALAKFIRDMIAFANTARRRGEPAHILFGVDNNGYVLPQGIRGQCTRVPLPADWDDDDPARFEYQQNQISRDLHDQVERYVRPGINFDYLPGRVDGVLVSHIAIRPEPVPQPFEVRRNLMDKRTGNLLLHMGQCWKREGESKHEVPESEKPFLYKWTDVPYINKARWVQHLNATVNEFTDEPGIYLDLSTQDLTEAAWLDQRVGEFLALDTERVLLLVGRPGTGKTRYLRKLIQRLAGVAWENLEATLAEQPQTPVPVFVNLAGYAVEAGRPFKRKGALCLDNHGFFGFNQANEPERVLADRSLRLVICLDAFDEMEPGARNARAIGEFLEEFPNLKVIVASRPNALPPTWFRQFAAVSIAQLSEVDVFNYLAADLKQPDRAYEFVRQNAELFEVARVPLMLKYVKEYWQGFEQQAIEHLEASTAEDGEDEEAGKLLSPSLGSMIDWLFHNMLKRERDEKDPTQHRELETIRQIESLSALARWMDGRTDRVSLGEARRYLRLRDITRLLNLRIIRTEGDGFCFFNDLVQAYFAALDLCHALSRGRMAWATRQITINRAFWQRCLEILRDLRCVDHGNLDPLFQRVSTLDT